MGMTYTVHTVFLISTGCAAAFQGFCIVTIGGKTHTESLSKAIVIYKPLPKAAWQWLPCFPGRF